MDDCCCGGLVETASGETASHVCRTKGMRVDELTVKALLTGSALRRFEPGAYRFCADAACEVVYFDDRGRTFTKHDVRVAVWQKETAGDRTICYCFGENECDMRDELDRTGASCAVERIVTSERSGSCCSCPRRDRSASPAPGGCNTKSFRNILTRACACMQSGST